MTNISCKHKNLLKDFFDSDELYCTDCKTKLSISTLVETLQFYADKGNWNWYRILGDAYCGKGGRRARKTLGEEE